jgi:hypothetical protein
MLGGHRGALVEIKDDQVTKKAWVLILTLYVPSPCCRRNIFSCIYLSCILMNSLLLFVLCAHISLISAIQNDDKCLLGQP